MAGAIRQPIDIASLSRFIDRNVSEIKLPIDVEQFGFGQSNPTYQLTASDGVKFVMRKKPPGKLLSKTAHQVEREYRIIHALETTDVPVPKALCLCEDPSVVGTPFYIMEFLDGRIFEDASFPGVSPQERKEMWHDAIRTLAKFHRIDPTVVGLASFGKHSGFYDRQIKTLGRISIAQAQTVDVETKETVGKISHFDEMIAFFSDTKSQPKDRGTLVHGDYKIDNLVYHKTEPRVIGILDWEMSTIGHPLSDVSNVLSPFTLAASPKGAELVTAAIESFAPSAKVPGLPSRSQLMQWYAEIAGWDPRPEATWGDAFGVVRNSVIMQGIKARLALRQATSLQAKHHADRMEPFGEYAWTLVQEAMSQASRKAKL